METQVLRQSGSHWRPRKLHDHVADVGELVGEHQNGDSGDTQRQPGELGMMRVHEDAMLLHP